MHILLIEDSESDYVLIKRALNHDATVPEKITRAQTLQAAIRAMKEQSCIELIITDLNLPDSRGIDTALRLLIEAKEIPVIILSGHADLNDAMEAIRHGAQDFINKDQLEPYVLRKSIDFAVERKQLQLELEHAIAGAQQSNRVRSVGRLAGGLAHNINNILTIIQGYTESAFDALEDRPDIRLDLDQVLHATRRASELTHSLLAVGGQQVVQPRKLNLSETFKQSVDFFNRSISSVNEIRFKAPEPVWVMANDVQMNQVMTNLILNAVDAMPNGGVIRVQIKTTELTEADSPSGIPPGTWALIEVNDEGTGVPEDLIEQISDPFFTTKDPEKHQGLGIPIVLGIANQSNGHLRFFNRPEGGASFQLYLPLVDLEENDPSTTEPPVEQVEESSDDSKVATILVVDDEVPIRMLVSRTLERCGYRVLQASNGQEGLDQFEEDLVDLVISDVVMPIMDGPTMVHRIRDIKHTIPCILISGFSRGALEQEDWFSEEVQILSKPFTPKDLTAQVETILAAPNLD